jgi:hypothetical protein
VLGWADNRCGTRFLKVIDAWPNAKTTELIGIEEINKPNNCEFANQISDRLLKYDDRSAQGWYMKAICNNSAGTLRRLLKTSLTL